MGGYWGRGGGANEELSKQLSYVTVIGVQKSCFIYLIMITKAKRGYHTQWIRSGAEHVRPLVGLHIINVD